MAEVVLPETGCPACYGRAVPEEEDGLTKYVCTDQEGCGYEFGFALTPEAAAEENCQLGIPLDIRVSASQPPGVMTLKSGGERSSVFLGATIPRRPEE